jgi:hypothetical protein
MKMAELNLNDVRGFWRDLAAPAFVDFWDEYQADLPVDSRRFSIIYRRLVSAALLINHQSDKVASGHNCGTGFQFMDKVAGSYPDIAKSLHACRFLVNDLKHHAHLLQEAVLRDRKHDFDSEGAHKLLAVDLLLCDGEVHDVCLTLCTAFRFWVDYFSGIGDINFQQTLRRCSAQ